jgi:hypothetical protein
MSHKNLILALLITLVLTCPVWADLMVTVGNLDLAPGETGSIDVTIAGDGDLLQTCGFEFRIQTAGATRLEFVDPQPYGYLEDADYVFVSDTFAWKYPPVGAVSETTVPGDTFIGGDMTLSIPDVIVTDSKLMARLQVTSDTTLPPEAGDSFTISLEPSSSSYFSGSGVPNILYTATTGTVNIVPEPGTMALLVITSAFMTLASLFHKRV